MTNPDAAIPTSAPISGWRDWTAVAVLSTLGTFLSMIFLAVAPIQIALSAHFGGGEGADTLAQWVMGVAGFGMAGGGILAGFVIDRLGLRGTLVAGLGCYGLLGAAGLVVDEAWSLLASRLLLGVAGVVFATAAATLLSQRFEGAARARVLGFQNAIASVGGLLVIYLSAALAAAFGWRWSFALFLIAFVPLLAAMVAMPRRSPTPRLEMTGEGLLPLAPLYGLITFIMAATFIGSIQAPFILKQDGLATEGTIGTLIAVSSIAFGIGGVAYGWIRPRLGARFVMALGLVAMGAGAIIIGALPGLGAANGGVLVLGIGGGVLVPNLINILIDGTSESVRDRAIGLFFTASFIGTPLNTIIMPLLTRATGLRGAVLLAGALLLAGAFYAVLRRPARAAS